MNLKNLLNLKQRSVDVYISPAENEDIYAIAQLHSKCFARGWSESEFESLLSSKNQMCFVARRAKKDVTGFILVRQIESESEILSLAVDSKYWGLGIGHKLLHKIISILQFSPAKKLMIEVSNENERALSLYRRAGFTLISERDAYYQNKDGSKATALVMSYQLG